MLTHTGSSSTWKTELELFYSGNHVSLLETTVNHFICLRCYLREDTHWMDEDNCLSVTRDKKDKSNP